MRVFGDFLGPLRTEATGALKEKSSWAAVEKQGSWREIPVADSVPKGTKFFGRALVGASLGGQQRRLEMFWRCLANVARGESLQGCQPP